MTVLDFLSDEDIHREGVNWQKWVGEYQDRLSPVSKTHLTDDGLTTLCGQTIPSYSDGYEVSGDASYNVDCKKCKKAA